MSGSNRQESISLVVVITGLSANGAEIMLLKLLERIDRKKFSPHVISLSTLGEIGPRISALGIPVEALGVDSIVSIPRAFYQLIKRFRAIRPAVVHTWMYHADLLGGVAARVVGIRAVTWGILQSNLSSEVNKYSTLLVARACALLSPWLPARILSCSRFGKIKHVEFGYKEDKFFVLPLGFDLTIFRPDAEAYQAIRVELGLQPNTPLVGLVGRFDPQKNHLGFLEACAIVRRSRPDVHFLLVGNGVDHKNQQLQAAIAGNRLLGVVHLVGARKDIPRIMAALDVLASSSHGEGFPNVLGEAMATGVPCVVTNVGDSAFVVQETGIIVEPGDMQGLAKGLLQVLFLERDELNSLGREARRRIDRNFEIEAVVRQYETYYKDLLHESLNS